MDWKRELVIAHLVKQKVAEVDVENLWKNTLPGLAATPHQLQALEARLGHRLDPQHREFLLHANGWHAFEQHIDLFAVEDLEGGHRAERAAMLVETLEPLEPLCGLGKRDVMPFAVSANDIDVMLVTLPHTAKPGQVLWLAGGLIDTFTGFDAWFLAMVDYNRAEYQRLAKEHADLL